MSEFRLDKYNLPWSAHWSCDHSVILGKNLLPDAMKHGVNLFIVEACNNYESQKIVIDKYIAENKKLKEALKDCIEWFETLDKDRRVTIGEKFYESSVRPLEQLLKEE